MKRLRARPDAIDLMAADAVMRHTGKRIEAVAKVLTRLGDEKILLPLALVAWLAASPRNRKERAHILKTLLAVSALDHGSKSGHAIHLGALASALSRFHPQAAPYVWAGAIVVAGSRVVLLAHWLSDVLLGLTVGAMIEQAIWAATGNGRGKIVR